MKYVVEVRRVDVAGNEREPWRIVAESVRGNDAIEALERAETRFAEVGHELRIRRIQDLRPAGPGK